MANPNWKIGGPSPNPNGRKKMKNSALTVKGKVERFIKANLNQRQLQRIYNELDAKDQFKVLTELMPYILPKQNSLTADLNLDSLNDNDLAALYNKVTETINYEMVLPHMSDEQVKAALQDKLAKSGYVKVDESRKLLDNDNTHQINTEK